MKTQTWIVLGALIVGCDDLGDDGKDDTDSGAVDTETDVVDTETDVGETDTGDAVPAPEWNEDFWPSGWEDFIDCSEGEVTFTAETLGFGYDAELYLAQTEFTGGNAWDEQHSLEEIAAGGTGATSYSTYERELSTGVTVGNQAADASTIFTCSQDTDPPNESDPGTLDPISANFQVTFAIAVYDEDDNLSDCLVFGNDPDGLIADPDADGRTPPAWLTAANCHAAAE